MAGGWSGTFPAKPRPALAQALAGPGKPGPRPWQGRGLWQAQGLAGSGRLWQALAGSGRLWQALAGSGRLWQTLANSGKLWQTLANSGKLWQTLANSGKLWQTLANSEKPASGGPVLFLGVTRFFVAFKGIIIFMRLYASRLDKGSARPRKLTLPGRLEDWSPAVQLARHACSTPSLLGGLAALEFTDLGF